MCISPDSTCCVTSGHDKHDGSCVLCRACSKMADDKEAVVLACKTISHFIFYLLFQLTNKINSFIKTNYGDHNFIHITNKVAYRTRGDGRVAFAALVMTCLLYST